MPAVHAMSQEAHPPQEVQTDDRRYELGKAYDGIKDQMRFNQQRRINLATGIGDQSIKAFALWVTIFGVFKSLPVDYKAAINVMETVFLWLPAFAMFLCIVYMFIGRSVYQDEINYIIQGLKYEERYTGKYGFANARFREITDASYFRPATTEVAGIMWFSLWFILELISRYNTL